MKQTESDEPTVGDRDTAQLVRDFDFARGAVFRMFTDPKKAAQWFGVPEGAVPVLFELDARIGGTIRIHDQQPGESLHQTVGTIVELVEPERIAYRTTTTLEEGAVPFEALQTVTLQELGPKRTRVVVVVKVLSAGTIPGGAPALLEGFQGGWGQTFDKLVALMR